MNNYYKVGPATEKRNTTIQRRIASVGIRTSDYTHHNTDKPNEWDKMWHVWGKYYVNGNVNSKYSDVTKDNWTYGMYNQIDNSSVDNTYTQATKDTMKVTVPIKYEVVTTHTAEQAYDLPISTTTLNSSAALNNEGYGILANDAGEGVNVVVGTVKTENY